MSIRFDGKRQTGYTNFYSIWFYLSHTKRNFATTFFLPYFHFKVVQIENGKKKIIIVIAWLVSPFTPYHLCHTLKTFFTLYNTNPTLQNHQFLPFFLFLVLLFFALLKRTFSSLYNISIWIFEKKVYILFVQHSPPRTKPPSSAKILYLLYIFVCLFCSDNRVFRWK